MRAEEAEVKAVVKIDPAIARRAMMDNSARAASGAGASTSAAGSSQGQRAAANGGDALASQLWVEKHKPRDSRELVGNQATIEWLRVFLRNWCAGPTQPSLWQPMAAAANSHWDAGLLDTTLPSTRQPPRRRSVAYVAMRIGRYFL